VSGDAACFTRPEFKVERVSYEVMTPSAARGLLEAIYWRPGVRWWPTAIHVLKPIKFNSVRRNELGQKIAATLVRRAVQSHQAPVLSQVVEGDRQQRASSILIDVAYVIEATLQLDEGHGKDHNVARHLAGFVRRAARGQTFHQPYLGTREFPARFRLLGPEEPSPVPINLSRNLGLMLYDIEYDSGHTPRFFRGRLDQGVLHVPPLEPVQRGE